MNPVSALVSDYPVTEEFRLSYEDIKKAGLPALKYYYEETRRFHSGVLPYIKYDLGTLMWLHSVGYPLANFTVYKDVSKPGNLDALKWLYKNVKIYQDSLFAFCVRHGNFDAVKWLHSVGCSSSGEGLFRYTMGTDNLDMLKWLHAHEYHMEMSIFDAAMIYNNLEAAKWLYSLGYPAPQEIDSYLDYNAFEILNWLHDIGCSFSERTFLNAAQNNDIEMLRWLRSVGCPLPRMTIILHARDNGIDPEDLVVEEDDEIMPILVESFLAG